MRFSRRRFGAFFWAKLPKVPVADYEIKKALEFLQRLEIYHLEFSIARLPATEENRQKGAAAQQGNRAGFGNNHLD